MCVGSYDYFYGRQAEQFQFFKLPKILVREEAFKDLSMDAKVLYSMMLDRAALSAENGWLDEAGRVYIFFTNSEICELMKCANQKATKLLRELEKEDLIRRRKSGFNQPDRIYVMNFASCLWRRSDQSHENHDSGDVKIMIPESWKSRPNKTENNKTEYSNTDLILSLRADDAGQKRSDEIDQDMICRYFYEQLDIPALKETHPYDGERIGEILELLVDICGTETDTVLVGKVKRPWSVVRSRLMKLTYSHIEYVLHSLNENRADVRNIRQYLLASLYNAPATMSSYYQAKVNHDMAAGLMQEGGGDEYQ